MDAVRRHPVIAFFALAYAFSWAVWVPMAVGGTIVRQGDGWPTHAPGLVGPFAAAVAVTYLVEGRRGIRRLAASIVRWRTSPVWYLVAFSPIALFAAAYAALAALGEETPALSDLGRFSGFPATGVFAVWVMLTAVNALGEEAGWRGYAVPQLQSRRGALGASLVIGVLWAGWHLPSFFVIENYRTLGAANYPGFVLGILAGSVFLTWLYNRSGGSVLIVSLWHGTYNLFGASAAAKGTIAAVVSTAIVVWAVVLLVADRRLGRPNAIAPPSTRSAAVASATAPGMYPRA